MLPASRRKNAGSRQNNGQSYADKGTSTESPARGKVSSPRESSGNAEGNRIRFFDGPKVIDKSEPIGPKGAPYRDKGAVESK